MRSEILSFPPPLLLAVAFWAATSSFSTSLAAEAPAGRLVNRTLLTVGSDVYTAWDASVLACASAVSAMSATDAAPDALATRHDWLSPPIVARKERLRPGDVATLPPEARRFLFVALVWGEARKLNLFVPPEKDLEAGVKSLRLARDSGRCVIPGGGPEAVAFLSGLPDARVRGYVDLALRAKSFERVRGPLEKNPNLLSQTWFWHASTESRPQ